MIDERAVWQEIWPQVEQLIEGTLAEDNEAIKPLLASGQPALAVWELFGYPVFDLLLKTVLGRGRLALTRAVEVEERRQVFIEYAWPDPEQAETGYTAADVVSIRLQQKGESWQIAELNPATIDLPLTEPRAAGIMISSQALRESDKIAVEPWILPVALFSGGLQLPLRPTAARDNVEAVLLPGIQERAYGLPSLLNGRRLWREYKKKAQPNPENPAGWAAAVEYILNEQMMREQSQASIVKRYQTSLPIMARRVKNITKTLAIRELDERYSALRPVRVILDQG